ncbi:MAG: ABC transporter ATP-binding protein [Planctomycetia bacterium]|nr:ABC transporter ATP-binding protein [Planctomycetia bacterium]
MTAPIISVENLGKRYTLRHQARGYQTLRDTLALQARRLFGGLRRPADAHQTSPAEDFWALKDVSFEIERGDVVGIIGRNGAGKSTLLKILSRIVEPTTGSIRLRGRVASLLEVGTGFHPELTGRENIFLNGAILGMSKAEIRAKFDEIVAFAEVEKFLDTPVKHYSSGMYVRLAFAVAAHLEPEILIVDEVLAVGDVAFQKKCMGKMKDVASRDGRTILFVSHNMGAVGTLCNRAVLLDRGSVEMVDKVDAVVSHYVESTASRGVTDLASLRWPGRGELIRFTSLRMADDTPTFDYNQPIVVEMEIESDRDFSDLSIGASIFTQDGHCVGTLFTGDTFSIRRNTSHALRLRIERPRLAPHRYYCGFSIGTGGFLSERYDYEVVIGTPAFSIVPRAETGLLASWHRSWGDIHFDANSLEPIAAETEAVR